MLTHTTIGNMVVYPTPGCNVPTVACQCRTPEQATTEAARLNTQQEAREQAIKLERELCGLHRIQRDHLGGFL